MDDKIIGFVLYVRFKDDFCFEPEFTFSKLTIETLQQGVKYVQS